MPLGLYARHEAELLQEPSGCAEDITKTKAFRLLVEDPEARLIINRRFRLSKTLETD
jgi:abhydrolase domain-containing protein 12